MSEIDLIRENIRKKEKARAALKAAADAEARAQAAEQKLADLQAKYDQLQTEYNELDTEVTAYLDEADANPAPPTPDEVMAELAQYRRQDKLSKIQTALDSSGKFRKGTKAEHLARIAGVDIDELTAEDMADMEAFTANWVELASKEAPIFLGEPEPAGTGQEQTNGRSSALAAARRLPTFTERAQGGGTPPPADTPLAIERLRDPAAALARANAARKQAFEQA